MMDLKGKLLGDFDFYTRKISEEEKKYYGIFISHSSRDNEKYLYPLRDMMIQRGLYPFCDRDFLYGGDEYQTEIEKALDCYAAVIVLTESSLNSDWVNYEIGFLSGRNKPIFIYDPEKIFSPESRKNNNVYDAIYNTHFKKIGALYFDIDTLLEALSTTTPYSNMFSEETDFLGACEFYDRIGERVESVIAVIETEIFDKYYSDFGACKFGILLTNFGMFYKGHGDGEHCYVNHSAPIDNATCPHSAQRCALCADDAINETNKECVLLNHVMYTGTLRRHDSINREGKRVECGCIEFSVPVHKLFGTEFKFIIDVEDNSSYNRIMHLLDEAGMNPSFSESNIGGRIYLSLPDRRSQGLFRLDHEFSNNFLCPGALK